MLNDWEIESQIKKNERRIKELAINISALDKDIKNFLVELNVTPQQLTLFLNNQDNFTEENWKEVIAQRFKANEKLQRDLAQIRDPQAAKKKWAERNVGQHWLYVK